MYRRSVPFVFILSVLMSAALLAQDNGLGGTWVAPITKGSGPGFLTFTFNVKGDTFTGTLSDTGGRANPFTEGKIENGRISFAFPVGEALGGKIVRTFTGTFKDPKHLDLVDELRILGHPLMHRPGSTAAPNTLEGEWVEVGRPGPPDLQPVFVFHPQGEKLTGEVIEYETRDGELGDLIHSPFTNGVVHGSEFSIEYKSSSRNPMRWTGKLVGDRMIVDTDVKKPYRAVRMPDAPASTAGNAAGLWVLPVTKGTGPGFLLFSFQVNGNSLTGSMSDKGGPAEPIANGKVENEHISFSFPKEQLAGAAMENSYSGTLTDAKHLALDQDLRMAGFEVVRKPGTQGPPNSLEGQWVLKGNPGVAQPVFVIRVQGDKVTGEYLDHDIHDNIVGKAVTLPFTDGAIHGSDFSFGYNTRRHEPIHWTGKIVGDHLVMDSDLKRSVRAIRLDSSGTGTGAQAAGAAPATQTTRVAKNRLERYRSLAQMAMEAVKKNDMATASKHCRTLEQEWDDSEQGLRQSNPDIWGQVDRAMDEFIHPIMRSGGTAPNAATLDAAYQDFLNKLKLAG